MKNLFHLCVQGDVNDIYKLFTESSHKTEVQVKLENKYYNRFFKENPDYKITNEDSWIEDVINTYRSYFVDVLTNKVGHSVAESTLFEKLNCHLPFDVKGTDMFSTEESIKEIFKKKGFGFIGGRVAPHYGPFIWGKLNKETYSVETPDFTGEVQVCFLDDFLMLSWLHFATFGELYAGGWAKKDVIYCVLSNYRDKLDTDVFQVSFLKHEAQHISDYKQFPNLKGTDLEYRAKLVELIYYSNFEFFEKLLVQAIHNTNPHNHSAFIILKKFSNHFFNKEVDKDILNWKKVHYDEISHFALKLFNEHTVKLKSLDAATVKSVI